jgi:hypothetical protein
MYKCQTKMNSGIQSKGITRARAHPRRLSIIERLVYLSVLVLISPFCMADHPGTNTSAVIDTEQFETQLSDTQVTQLTRWGIAYEHGHGVKKNLTFAIKLLCKAARREHGPAQYELGWIYMNGRNGKRDLALAAAWFQQATSQGDPHAKRLLKLMGGSENPEIAQCLLPDGTVVPQSTHYPESIDTHPSPDTATILAWVKQLAPEYDLRPELVLAVIRTESNFDAHARSPKNACGLMQLVPATAQRFGVTDIWDPLENLKGGMAYLQWLQNYFKGDLRLTLAAYNAGEGAVNRYNGVPPYK